MKFKHSKQVICILLSVILAVMACFFSAGAASVSEYEDELENISAKIASNKEKLSEIAADKEKNEEYLNTLEEQLSDIKSQSAVIQEQIDALNIDIEKTQAIVNDLDVEITKLNNDIKNTKAEIKNIENKIQETYVNLSKRLRASYMTGEDSNLKILLGADSIASFLTRLEMMKRISDNDTKMVNDFKSDVKQLKSARTTLEEKKQQQEASLSMWNEKKDALSETKSEWTSKKSALDSSVAEYESSYAQIEEYIEQLDQNSSTYRSYISKLQSDYEQAEAEMNDIIARASYQEPQESTTVASENNSGTAVVVPSTGGSSDFMWPVGNQSSYISSGYGGRDDPLSGYSSSHGGIDITMGDAYGRPIYASRAGTVIGAIPYDSSSYGKYVVIDHGDGYSTIYAHCSSLAVSEGEYVSKGQLIAYIGDTGRVTGPHLHFEIRYNGERVNPSNYVSN